MDRIAYGMIRRGFCSKLVGRGDVSSANVRKTFLEYFQRDHNHLLIPSSPVMPNNDATISFVNSGMNQFKGVFLGEEIPAAGRVVNSQKCIRIKGKHNDLSQVGLDGTHHTFFEMLGNWSFGDYFKKEACLMSWNLLTKVYGIPAERLYVTYFKGDEELGLSPDLETREIWLEIGLPKNRVLPFGMTENFWEMAVYGPCGPCTEIHYDHVPGREDASALVNTGDPSVTELWNLVFIEFNRTKEENLQRLGNTFVDTGMGYERLVAVLQGQTSNYETDLFRPLFDVIERLSGVREYTATYGEDKLDVAYRLLADHARMLTVALSDGMTPNIHNRVRVIFRKAFTVQQSAFRVEKGIVKELSNHVAEMLSPVYPEIGRNLKRVQWLIDEEEKSFIEREAKAIENWLNLLKKVPKFASIKTELREEFVRGYKYIESNVLLRGRKEISKEVAWKLFDTNGMSESVIERVATILGLSFDKEEFAEYRRELSEKSRVEADSKYREQRILLQKAESESVGVRKVDDKLKYQYEMDITTGNYQLPEIPVSILSVFVDGKPVDRVDKEMVDGKVVDLVLDRTSFFHKTAEYPSDTGVLTLSDTLTFKIIKVEKIGNELIHRAIFENPPDTYEFNPEMRGILRITGLRRRALMRGSTTALIFKALLRHRMKVFSEIATTSNHDIFKISFTGYPQSFELRDFLEMEKEMAEALKEVEPVERKWCNVTEIREMDDLIIRGGDTFIEAETPIARIHTPWGTARFRCAGPLVSHLSEVEHFVITNYETIGYRVKEITCVTGPRAAEAKERNAKYLEKWNELRNFHIISTKDEKSIERQLEMIQKFLKEVDFLKSISYFIKKSIMEEASAKIILLKKYARREVKSIRKEQRKLMK